MKVSEIRAAICSHFNSLPAFAECPFVQSRQDAPAPKGTYIAVGIESTELDGSMMVPNGGGDYGFLSVATVSMTEVEGDGDFLRAAMNRIERPEFRSAAWVAGFAVWDRTSVTAIDTFDGEFVVRQWRATFRVHFNEAEAADIETIATAEAEINPTN